MSTIDGTDRELTSYDDLIDFNLTDYYYSKVMLWIESVKGLHQIESAKRLIELFRRKYPTEHKLGQDLYRKFWQLKRELK